MRKALNENPVVRMVVLGVMTVAVAFLLYTRVISASGSGDEPPPPPTGTATESGTATPAPAAPASSAAPSTGSTPAPEAVTPAPSASGSVPAPVAPPSGDPASAFVPGPGLPEDVVVAYARNKAIVLLIAKKHGLDDQALALSSLSVQTRGDVEFIPVPVKDVAKYARITEGVELDRTPALVVIRPRKLTDNVPEAFIEYGYRGPESVQTVVEDALYDGKNVTYDP